MTFIYISRPGNLWGFMSVQFTNENNGVGVNNIMLVEGFFISRHKPKIGIDFFLLELAIDAMPS